MEIKKTSQHEFNYFFIDNDNQDGKRPEKIIIKLLANGLEIDHREVTGEAWNWKFENLDKYKEGEEIVYSITEDAVDGYGAKVNGYNVTNSYNPGKTSVQVTKSWQDKNNQDNIRPDSVTIKLLANGEATGEELVLTKNNQWTGTFTELDEYKDGAKINYTIEEVKVDGYETVITGDVGTGYIVTNTHEVKLIPIEKKPQKPNENFPKTGEGLSPILYGVGLLLVGSTLAIFVNKRKKEL